MLEVDSTRSRSYAIEVQSDSLNQVDLCVDNFWQHLKAKKVTRSER